MRSTSAARSPPKPAISPTALIRGLLSAPLRNCSKSGPGLYHRNILVSGLKGLSTSLPMRTAPSSILVWVAWQVLRPLLAYSTTHE